MKNLIVCADGTWCTEEQEDHGIPTPTNVIRLRNCVAEVGQVSDNGDNKTIRQLTYYHPGVGTEGGVLKRLKGGAWGQGLSKNIQSAYHWLAQTYQPGDRIFLFGFSRGAYTVRSLGGMLDCCGLLDLEGIESAEGWKRVKRAYKRGYRYKDSHAEWARGWAFHHEQKTPIRFIGVWDTVGALGVPDEMSFLNLFDQPRKWRFHDTRLGDAIEIARHALALDEFRASFTPTLWCDTQHADMKQVWFPGSHSDVGGGYAQTGLSDISLKWMVEEANEAGLAFKPDAVAQIDPHPDCVLHHSLKGIFRAVQSRPRNTPLISCRRVHDSARQRHENPPITQSPYRPTIAFGPGDEYSVDVYAREHWNETGLYLTPGAYHFSAQGEWIDWKIACGPGGTADGDFQMEEIAHVFGTTLGWLESGWGKLIRNEQADIPMTRRHEGWPWFALTGAIANSGGTPSEDGTPQPHEEFLIGDGTTRQVDRAGYLYAYTNDAWDFYGNNSGSVRLTVERVG